MIADSCGTCNVCDYRGYEHCPLRVCIVEDQEFVAEGPYADVIQEAYDAWKRSGKTRGRYYRTNTHWRR